MIDDAQLWLDTHSLKQLIGVLSNTDIADRFNALLEQNRYDSSVSVSKNEIPSGEIKFSRLNKAIEALGKSEIKTIGTAHEQEVRGDYVLAFKNPDDGKFYLPYFLSDKREVFIKFQGYLSTKGWGKYFIPIIDPNVSSPELQVYAEKYGDQITQKLIGVDLDSYGARYGVGGRLWYYSRKAFGVNFDNYIKVYNKLIKDFMSAISQNKFIKAEDNKIRVSRQYVDGSSGFIVWGDISRVITFSLPGKLGAITGAQFPSIDVFRLEKELQSVYRNLNS